MFAFVAFSPLMSTACSEGRVFWVVSVLFWAHPVAQDVIRIPYGIPERHPAACP